MRGTTKRLVHFACVLHVSTQKTCMDYETLNFAKSKSSTKIGTRPVNLLPTTRSNQPAPNHRDPTTQPPRAYPSFAGSTLDADRHYALRVGCDSTAEIGSLWISALATERGSMPVGRIKVGPLEAARYSNGRGKYHIELGPLDCGLKSNFAGELAHMRCKQTSSYRQRCSGGAASHKTEGQLSAWP